MFFEPSPPPPPEPPLQPPRREPETDAQALARQLEAVREMAELGLRAARAATARIEANVATPNSAEPAPSLTLTRATHVVRQAIALEQRLRAPAAPAASRHPASPRRPASLSPSAVSRDPRRNLLRDALRQAARHEPDRAARTQLCRFLDERVDAELADDPDAAIPAAELLIAISEEFGLPIDLSQLPNELLDLPPTRHPNTG